MLGDYRLESKTAYVRKHCVHAIIKSQLHPDNVYESCDVTREKAGTKCKAANMWIAYGKRKSPSFIQAKLARGSRVQHRAMIETTARTFGHDK